MELDTASMLHSETLEEPESWTTMENYPSVVEPARTCEVAESSFSKYPRSQHSVSADERQSILIYHIVNDFIVPTICVFGLVGNILNLIVLTREQLRCSLKPMERSVNSGLVALAVSDVLFCLFYLFVIFSDEKPTDGVYESMLKVYYKTYHEPVINIFLLSSTWLTVIMAVGRYIVVCRPIEARGFIKLRGTRLAIVLVFSGSVFFNVPRFWHYHVVSVPCMIAHLPLNVTSCKCFHYAKAFGTLYRNKTFKMTYNIIWAGVAIFVPFLVLIVCNICLIRALRRSLSVQKQYRVKHCKNSGQRITPTLVTLIVLFVILVGPSEMLTFLKDQVLDQRRLIRKDSSSSSYYNFRIAAVVTNALLLLNFAINVVLYCILNTQFRRVFKCLFCRIIRRGRSTLHSSTASYRNTLTGHVIATETEI